MLEKYLAKRNFDITPEPNTAGEKADSHELRFVVQKHAARRLHYDFRLELDGVLKSWAVPKGPSMTPGVRRLAVQVEDHPIPYGTFEGTIPNGQYGAGQVIVWDNGVYHPEMKLEDGTEAAQVRRELAEGKLHFVLQGKKLKGAFVLIHGEEENWFLLKRKDSMAQASDVEADGRSVQSGLTIDDIKAGKVPRPPIAKQPGKLPAANQPMPTDLKPMLLEEADEPFDDPDWQYELKLDGVRVIIFRNGADCKIKSRNGTDLTRRLTNICKELLSLPNPQFVLDGEIVWLTLDGLQSFSGLMTQLRNERSEPYGITLYAFDLLFLDGIDLRAKPLTERRVALEALGIAGPSVRVNDAYPATGKILYEQAIALGFEGIVGKRLSSTYHAGTRSRDWLKIKKYHSEEFLVGGFTTGNGDRSDTFGGLLVGRQGANGLAFCASVGSGFSDSQLKEIRNTLRPLETKENPFTGPLLSGGRDHEIDAHWIRPELSAEIRFQSWTKDRHLRIPIFVRMRTPEIEQEAPMPVKDPETTLILSQLDGSDEDLKLEVGGQIVHLTHLSKALWPPGEGGGAVTKRDLIRYYAAVSVDLLRHLRDRPLSLVRHPNGIGGPGFFSKHPLPGTPDYVERVCIWSEHNHQAAEWMLCNNLASLLWFGQMGCVEIHPWYSRTDSDEGKLGREFEIPAGLEKSALNFPDYLVIDLDPNIKNASKTKGEKRTFDSDAWKRTVEVAQLVKESLGQIKLESYIKTSGKTGLHLFVPLKRMYDYDVVRSMAETIGRHVEAGAPNDVTMVWSVKKRPQAVFFDHNQNVRGKTLAAPFSPRAIAGAPVSFPILWDEITKVDPQALTVASVPKTLEKTGDRWAHILENPQQLSE